MSRTLIIAEAGVNHNGSIEMAKRLIEKAAEAGVDYVKFQTFKSEKLVSRHATKAEYQKANTDGEDSQLKMLQQLELSHSDHLQLIEHCNHCGVKFLSTAFDLDSIDFLSSLNLDLWKIPSGEITNLPYLRRIAQKGGQVIMSTGMCTIEDIEMAVNVLISNGTPRENITLLHCNTEYPTPWGDVNLRAMHDIAQCLNLPVGYSDHTQGIEVPIAAVALGATVIEKHFTLDNNLPGPDHKASLEPHALKAMVEAIRHIELSLGNGVKQISESERKNITIARKSIVAATHISVGEIFTEENLTVKRPGGGISPMRWDEVIGTVATRNYLPDEMIE
ncbi:MAG: N-acetylneuraminate synthase [Muribaculaceae bacterium]|nr:N-acetylneuraminate synthase [Muribaculaceae bacterium]